MKTIAFLLLVSFLSLSISSSAQQSCDEFLELVKDQGSEEGTYYSFSSDAIKQVTFYEIEDDSYNTFYFAVVEFQNNYNEYIYQVSSDTEWQYSYNYQSSAGEAFWEYIQPYADVLGCGPDL